MAWFCRFSGNTGNDFTGFYIEGKNLAVSKMAVGVVNHTFVDHSGVTVAMLGIVGPEVMAPLFIPIMIHAEHDVRLFGGPGEDDERVIHGRSCRCVAAEFMNAVVLGLVLFFPENFSGGGIYAEKILDGFVMVRTSGEELVAPEGRRTVPLAGKLQFPFVILARPGSGHLGQVDAGAIGAMKPGPLLGKKGIYEKQESKGEKFGSVHNGDFLEMTETVFCDVRPVKKKGRTITPNRAPHIPF